MDNDLIMRSLSILCSSDGIYAFCEVEHKRGVRHCQVAADVPVSLGGTPSQAHTENLSSQVCIGSGSEQTHCLKGSDLGASGPLEIDRSE